MYNKWDLMYEKLKEYYSSNGTYVVLKGDIENKDLRFWIRENIKLYRENSLSQDKVDLLSQINFDFSLYGKQWDNWEKNFKKLKEIYLKTGNSNISQLKKTIGPWLSAQRVKYRQGDLSDSKIILLEGIDVLWNPSETLLSQWNKQYEKLCQCYKDSSEPSLQLKTWISAQRTAYRKKIILKERKDLLNKIGFAWSLRTN